MVTATLLTWESRTRTTSWIIHCFATAVKDVQSADKKPENKAIARGMKAAKDVFANETLESKSLT